MWGSAGHGRRGRRLVVLRLGQGSRVRVLLHGRGGEGSPPLPPSGLEVMEEWGRGGAVGGGRGACSLSRCLLFLPFACPSILVTLVYWSFSSTCIFLRAQSFSGRVHHFPWWTRDERSSAVQGLGFRLQASGFRVLGS